jgi:hypothetical protein
MSVRFGRCRTPLTCSVAESRVVLRLWENEPFFCPECARPLADAPPWDGPSGYRSLMLAAGLVLMVASAGSAAWLLLRPPPPPPAAPPHRAAAPLHSSPPRIVLAPKLPHTIPAPPPPPPALAVQAPLRHKALPPSKPKPAEPAQAPPIAEATAPDTAAAPPAHAPAVVEATAQAPTPAAPPIHDGLQPPPPQSARPPQGPRVVVLPQGSKLSFGPLQGVNLPSLQPRMIFANPDATRKPGSIDVDCRIGLDGIPSDCRKVADHGGGEVSDTILAWLGSGAIRYAPTVKDGRKVVARRVLSVNFGGARPQP